MDFLLFKTFISIEVLILFYYLGALVLPFFTYLGIRWIVQKSALFEEAYQSGKHLAWRSLSNKHKALIVILFAGSFLLLELIWRMMFEFLIAYIQIRDALLDLNP